MSEKKGTRPDVGASERAKMEAGTEQTTTSTSKFTTPAPRGQKISDYLSHGQAHAIPLRQLRATLGLSGRIIRLMIRAERLGGTPICEDSKSGYYLPQNADERDLCAKRLRHRSAQIAKVADTIAAADISGGDV